MPPTPKPTLTLYGSAMSTSRVLVALHEKALPYTFHPVDIAKGEQKSAEYKKLQPFGKVPVLEDDGFWVYESRAICRYLERKYESSGRKLMPDPSDYEGYGKFEQACSVEQSYFAAAAETIGTELVIKQKLNIGPPDLHRVAKAEVDLDAVLAVYNKILATQKYLVGDEVTLADLFHLPNGAALKAGKWKSNFEKYEHVERWFRGLQEREAWVRAAEVAGTLA